MLVAFGGYPNSAFYLYNAEGQRLFRQLSDDYNKEYWQVYGLDGELVAEYTHTYQSLSFLMQKEFGYRNGQMLVMADTLTVKWLVQDHLGTARMIVDASGGLTEDPNVVGYQGVMRHDYLPFGGEILPNQGTQNVRTAAQGYGNSFDSLRLKFTGKERDTETGLDYFGARYYANLQGRFAAADPLFTSGKPASPQSWNRYSYVMNNPLRLIDPTGLDSEDTYKESQQRNQTPPRKIYIFVPLPSTHQIAPVPADPQNGLPAAEIPGPNFRGLQGANVIVKENAGVTEGAVRDALSDPNGIVIIAAHATGERDSNNVYHADGFQLGRGSKFNNGESFDVKASIVCVFACDSKSIKGDFRMGAGQTFIGVDSGRDGYTEASTLSHGAYNAARALIGGQGADAAVSRANGAFTTQIEQRSSSGRSVTRSVVGATNSGDRFKKVP